VNLRLRPDPAIGGDTGIQVGRLGGIPSPIPANLGDPDALVLSATYFGRNTRNMIDFVSCFPSADPRCATRPFGFYDNVAASTPIGTASCYWSTFDPATKDIVLFLEDIGEDVYRIDRMMSQLSLSGILDKISGFVFGRCSNCRAGMPQSFTFGEILENYLRPLGIPAFYGSMISHEPNNFTLPVGIRAEMDAGRGTIRLLERSVV
jgi:hypothetical protein